MLSVEAYSPYTPTVIFSTNETLIGTLLSCFGSAPRDNIASCKLSSSIENFFSGYLTSASNGRFPSPSLNLRKSFWPITLSHNFVLSSAIRSAHSSGEIIFSTSISLCSLHFLLISSLIWSRYARYLSCLFFSFMSFCFFSYFLVSIGQRTVPSNMLTDMSNVGRAWVISPPFEITLLTDKRPVLIEVIPIVREGPSINANGTVSIFCNCGGGSIVICVCSISLWKRGERKK